MHQSIIQKKYRKYQKIFYDNGKVFQEFPKKDAAIVLQVILDDSEKYHMDYSDMILHLNLERILIHNLNHKDNKILAFKNIAISQIPNMYDLLKQYWYSNDFEESYFSLYYTIYSDHHNESYREILEAVRKAKFSDERKIEMILFM